MTGFKRATHLIDAALACAMAAFWPSSWRVIAVTAQLQTEVNTNRNRYPLAFKKCAEIVKGSATLLSFGCSNGDEVFTLAEQYFDNSTIVGVDVNHDCLKIARSRHKIENVRNNKIYFELSNEHFLKSMAPFNAVFAMSVLCLWPKTKTLDDISNVFPYSRFDEAVVLLDSLLAVGGVLTIINSNYSFEDTATARRYSTINATSSLNIGFVKRFKPSGHVDANPGSGVLFRKTS